VLTGFSLLLLVLQMAEKNTDQSDGKKPKDNVDELKVSPKPLASHSWRCEISNLLCPTPLLLS
jgi:hypothetical protein